MRGELLQRPSKVPFTERHDAIEAFLLHRPHEPLRVRVAVRRRRRRSNDPDTSGAEPLLDAAALLLVPIADQQPPLGEKPSFGSSLSEALDNERLIRVRRAPDHLNPPRLHIQQERHVVVTSPRPVQTSVVKKSAATSAGQCACRNVCQVVGR